MPEQLPFLSDEWIARFNEVLGRERRPAVPPPEGTVLAVDLHGADRTAGTDALDLVVTDARPQLTRRGGVGPAATARMPRPVFERLVLDADVPGLFDAWHAGTLIADGNREVLLYHAYHLYPGGPPGAAAAAAEVRSFTAP